MEALQLEAWLVAAASGAPVGFQPAHSADRGGADLVESDDGLNDSTIARSFYECFWNLLPSSGTSV